MPRISVCSGETDFLHELFATFIAGDDTVTKHDNATRVCGDVRFVRDHDDGLSFGREFLEHAHDFFRRLRVEVTGWFVGKQDGRTIDERTRDGDTLALTA